MNNKSSEKQKPNVEKRDHFCILICEYANCEHTHKYRYRISICLNYFKKLHKRDDLKRRVKTKSQQMRKKDNNNGCSSSSRSNNNDTV